eukprot:CAMPEP_0197858758 /NCGR_PEP_ID=MMETSP1438-20131217/32790_1 /TAXON_ID=1461541 /ORGANISM="Pterosperma sp., Strain CCMP1384" /LENGTH=232 /DNA_ID=CAMNT_0043475015 /DNA_START=73 /DNA_END=771 /DNA_ORIENTATION=+
MARLTAVLLLLAVAAVSADKHVVTSTAGVCESAIETLSKFSLLTGPCVKTEEDGSCPVDCLNQIRKTHQTCAGSTVSAEGGGVVLYGPHELAKASVMASDACKNGPGGFYSVAKGQGCKGMAEWLHLTSVFPGLCKDKENPDTCPATCIEDIKSFTANCPCDSTLVDVTFMSKLSTDNIPAQKVSVVAAEIEKVLPSGCSEHLVCARDSSSGAATVSGAAAAAAGVAAFMLL